MSGAAKKPRAAKAAPATDFTPDALALRTTDAKGRAHGGYQWPVEVGAYVECPDWKPVAECGHGFHGYLDGLGSRDQCSMDADALWWIVEVMRAECILIDGDKSKFPRCRVAYVGSFGGALARLPLKMVEGIFAQTKATKNTIATTGDSSAAATTGDSSAAATTGYRSAAATTGDRSAAATTGYRSAAATTGDRSAAATTGDRSAAATTGDRSAAATTGDRSAAATTGDRSAAATTGDRSAAATTGDSSAAATTGDSSAAATTGHRSAAATTGHSSAAATTGYRSAAQTSGKHSPAAALGPNSSARADDPTGAIVLTYWREVDYYFELVHIFAAKVGERGIEAGRTYRLNADGEPEVVA